MPGFKLVRAAFTLSWYTKFLVVPLVTCIFTGIWSS